MDLVEDLIIDIVTEHIICSKNQIVIESSSSSSDEEEHSLLQINDSSKIEKYVQHVVRNYSDMDFQAHFRLKRTSVENLMQELAGSWGSKRKPRMDIEKALLLCLWTISNQESFRGIGDRFGLDRGSTRRIFGDMCLNLYRKRRKYIQWPNTNQAAINAEQFYNKRTNGFPNVVGCVDGTHIAIPGRKNDNSFYNRKKFHSIVLQGVCDAEMRFIDVYVGWPGSVHDARVWKSSSLYDMLKKNDCFDKKYHLLGDCAYPMDWFLMKPYLDNGHLTSKQKVFNTTLSCTRVIIEQAFAKLKNSFRRLKYLYCINLRHAKHVMISTCILHNIIIEDGNETGFSDWELEQEFSYNGGSVNHEEDTSEGINKRKEITEYIYNRLGGTI